MISHFDKGISIIFSGEKRIFDGVNRSKFTVMIYKMNDNFFNWQKVWGHVEGCFWFNIESPFQFVAKKLDHPGLSWNLRELF